MSLDNHLNIPTTGDETGPVTPVPSANSASPLPVSKNRTRGQHEDEALVEPVIERQCVAHPGEEECSCEAMAWHIPWYSGK